MSESCGSETCEQPSKPGQVGESGKLRRRRWVFAGLKTLVVAVVLYALGRHIRTLSREWSDQAAVLAELHFHGGWFFAAGLAYVAGQVFYGFFWVRLLKALGIGASRFEMLRAYNIGTVGKYVPGKAFVVLTRTALIRGPGVSRLGIGFATVYETLATMAVGSAVAAACLLLVRPAEPVLWLGAMLMSLGLMAAIHPALFGRLARLVTLPFKESNSASTRSCGTSTRRADIPASCRAWHLAALRGWIVLPFVGWLLSGTSFWAVAHGMGLECSSVSDWLLLTGTAGLATVVGVLVLFMPAGIGVRELVIIHLLAPLYGPSQAVLASLLLRTIWTAGELALAGLLYIFPLLARFRVALPGMRKMQNPTSTSLSDDLHPQ
jgi:uncharacterized membrane protein YbhN (UPF0104 family)